MIALRFQRAELEQKAGLSTDGLATLASAPGPEPLIAGLSAGSQPFDAVRALTLMLPHRQTVWWACLAMRLLPDLAKRLTDLAAVEAAEAWVQSVSGGDAERAGAASEAANLDMAPGWAAMAAFWAGPSLAPRGQQPVAPPPHLPGVAARAALMLLMFDPAMGGKLTVPDLLEIGTALLRGDTGRNAQTAVRERLGLG